MRIEAAPSMKQRMRPKVQELGKLKTTDCFCLYNPNDERSDSEKRKSIMMVVAPVKDGKVKVVALNAGETAGNTDLLREFSQEILVVKRPVKLQVGEPETVPVVEE